MDLYLNEREAYLKEELRNLETEYLKLVKIQQNRETVKDRLEVSLNNCIQILQRYGSNCSQSSDVKICRKDFNNDYKDLLVHVQHLSKCLNEKPNMIRLNKYCKDRTGNRFIDMAASSSGHCIHAVNIRVLDDRLLEMLQLSVQLRDEASKCVFASPVSLVKQIICLETVLRETLQLNMAFPSYDLPRGMNTPSYEAILNDAVYKERCDNLEKAIAAINLNFSDEQVRISSEISDSVTALRSLQLALEEKKVNERVTHQRVSTRLATFSGSVSSQLHDPLRQLALAFDPLTRVASNDSLKRFLEKCRLQIPLLKSFLVSYDESLGR